MTKIAIQGIRGCFHDEAAREMFKGREIGLVECETFNELFERLEADASLLGMVAIENTIAGGLLPNHELLRKSNHRVVGEVKLRIGHCVCALPGETLETITEINSHPMALMQCEAFLRRHPSIKVIEKFDTAGSAREISRRRLKGHAAICSTLAARTYGLKILEDGVETNKRNFTRFLLIADPLIAESIAPLTDKPDKAAIVFTLPHRQGALSKVLTILSFYDINLSKIQSTPIVGREWEYRFYVDLTFDSYLRYRQAITAVTPLLSDLKILGEYIECKNEI